ncbi:MAG: hypothetical protein AB1467_01940 [Candidatus Diapherotrites archaeon]
MQKTFRLLIVFAALIFVSFDAAALAVKDIPNYINFYQEPQTISFTVENDSGFTEELNIEISAPVRSEVMNAPEDLMPEEKALIQIKFYPEKRFIGSTYESTITIALGEISEKKNLTLKFNERNECPIDLSATQKNKTVNGAEVIQLNVSISSNSSEDLTVKFYGIKGLPSNWLYEPQNKSLSIEGNAEKSLLLTISPKSTFTGSAFINFKCLGFEKSKKVDLNFSQAGFASGLVTAISGMPWLDIILIIIAALLLIAFIARLVIRIKG